MPRRRRPGTQHLTAVRPVVTASGAAAHVVVLRPVVQFPPGRLEACRKTAAQTVPKSGRPFPDQRRAPFGITNGCDDDGRTGVVRRPPSGCGRRTTKRLPPEVLDAFRLSAVRQKHRLDDGIGVQGPGQDYGRVSSAPSGNHDLDILGTTSHRHGMAIGE